MINGGHELLFASLYIRVTSLLLSAQKSCLSPVGIFEAPRASFKAVCFAFALL